MKLILASSSPRRLELLASMGIVPHHIMHPEVNETPLKHEGVRHYVQRIACLKARAIHDQSPDAYILAADTAVELGGKILLKAQNQEEARTMLTRLSGRRHRVHTSVCVMSPQGQEACRTVLTRLSLKHLSKEELDDYLASKEWEGKAGAFSIQGKSSKFVKFLSGSYTNVVGLPLYETDCLLKGLGFRG